MDRSLFLTFLTIGILEGVAIPASWLTGELEAWTPQVGLWLYLYLLLLWVYNESKRRADIFRPYDFGLILVFFWPLYLPYYFMKTRGALGLLLFLGLCLLPYFGVVIVVTIAKLQP